MIRFLNGEVIAANPMESDRANRLFGDNLVDIRNQIARGRLINRERGDEKPIKMGRLEQHFEPPKSAYEGF